MNKLANALMGNATGGGASAPEIGTGSMAPNASLPTTAAPSKGLGAVSPAAPAPPASPKPPTPTAPMGAMTTPAIGAGISPLKGATPNKKLANALREDGMPASMKPIAPPKPPAPPKPFSPKPVGLGNKINAGATKGTL